MTVVFTGRERSWNMNKLIIGITLAIAATTAVAKGDNKDKIVYTGEGRYSCQGSSSSCDKFNARQQQRIYDEHRERNARNEREYERRQERNRDRERDR